MENLKSQQPSETTVIRVLILDASPITRSGLGAVLRCKSGIDVVAEACDHHEAVTLMAETKPHVVVHTVESPNGSSATLRQAKDWQGKVLALVSDSLCDSATIGLIGKDADGTLLRSAQVDDLVAALHMLVAGYSLFPAPVAAAGPAERRLPSAPLSPSALPRPASTSTPCQLTPREHDVLRLLGRGRTNAEISVQLTLSESTVKSHVQNLLAKLGLRNRVEAALYAVEAGLVD
ncbi:response regulator transcription factor [Streptomyces sp. Go40/10]|uniref:LuxR C-terminal-related transcriptional regulator n=1 Tax=Streptomyces sp. Go40/10 TaxID=2825844 RepID=UPI001E42F63A|nr:response regulator transcription factor [Streptomyces sp. Go40/10]UFR05808.1 response regulator transcription factor [Streptomyces sp. Go40/10]